MRFLATVVTVLACVAAANAGNNVLCYFESWAQYHSGTGHFTPNQIPAKGCTHIVYSFILPQAGGQVAWFGDDATLNQIKALKNQNGNLKVLAAIGGWNAGGAVFSNIVRDGGQRAAFVQSLADFVNQRQLDGIDIDWEYPTQNGGAGDDGNNYITFLRDLRNKLGWNKLITAAVGASPSLIGGAYNVAAMNQQLSFINLMAYDYHGAYDGKTGQNAPLYASSADADRNLNSDASVNAWIRAGASPGKLLLGLGFYGHNFQLADNNNHGVGAPTVAAGQAGPYNQQAGFVSYLEICEWQKQGGWQTVYDNQQQSVYTFKGNQWIGYDNPQSIKAKAQYALNKGLGGVMMWAIDHDDAYNSCGGGSMPLLNAVNSVIKH